MPKAVSKKQYRMMMAIAHGGPKTGRQPPKSIADKYSKPDKKAPESKDNDRGGNWDAHHEKHSEEKDDKKDKKKLKKAFEQFYAGKGAGTIVLNEDGHILVGKDPTTGKWQLPGGHVDPGEDFAEAAHRELREEANIVAGNMIELGHFKTEGNDSKAYLVQDWKGKPKDSAELVDIEFCEPHILVDRDLREAAKQTLDVYLNSGLKKNSLQNILAQEKLAKNILRGGDQRTAVYDVSHGDALRLVGNGCFRWLSKEVKDMTDEDFKDLHLDNYVISVRKHLNDVYSGRISDGHKMIHQFTNKSLPQLCADVMSVFEWYSDDDEHVFDILDEDNLSDDAIHGGINELTNNYTKHNLANIYTEMENIREEIRSGNAVDLQQVEQKVMHLFDKLEDQMQTVVSQHNKLSQDAGKEIEMLEARLKELALKIDDLTKKPSTVEAYQTGSASPDKVYNSHYNYLAKPSISIDPSGKISISFDKEWTNMEKSNYLKDMKAVLIKRR